MRMRSIAAALLSALLVALVPSAGWAGATPTEDPALEQQIDPDQEIVDDDAVLDEGHVDMGPRFRDGGWELMVHDDTQLEGSVWRGLPRTAIHVLDTALLQVPDDPAYAFLGVEPGESAHVVPQTQRADVVWLGWNTQDPDVMSTVDGGVTLSLQGVEGPGEMIVYLQDGGFGDPDVLWDSRQPAGQELWVDVNTHTHANWVFTEPGVYLVQLEARADLVDGATVSDTRSVRFAIGDQTDPTEALAAEEPAIEAAAAETDEEADGSEAAAEADEDGRTGQMVLIAVALGAFLLVAALTWVSLRSRRVKAAAAQGGVDRDGATRDGVAEERDDR